MEISSPKQKEGFLKIEKRIKVERGRSDKGVRALETGDLEKRDVAEKMMAAEVRLRIFLN